MALKPTIFKFDIALSDLDRDRYQDLNLTVARHPSETAERMMARVLANCLNAEERLRFGGGLSSSDEPDLLEESLDSRIVHWIDVGEPAPERLKKAARRSEKVSVYSFNSKSDTWWRQHANEIARLPVAVFQFPWASIQVLAGSVQRSNEFSITVAESTLFVSGRDLDVEIACSQLSATVDNR